jgi:hypothetical protein
MSLGQNFCQQDLDHFKAFGNNYNTNANGSYVGE